MLFSVSSPTGARAREALTASAQKRCRVAIKTGTEERSAERTQLMPLYHTVVHNCECHTFEDVIFGLMRIVGTGLRDAELKAKEIDFFGRGVVATTTLELAEFYANACTAKSSAVAERCSERRSNRRNSLRCGLPLLLVLFAVRDHRAGRRGFFAAKICFFTAR